MTTKSQDRRKVRLSRALGVALTPKAARYLDLQPIMRAEAVTEVAINLNEKGDARDQ